MPIVFYPYEDDLNSASLEEKLEVLMDAAERYKAAILDIAAKTSAVAVDPLKRNSPKDVMHAFNWEEIAKVLREIREMSEGTPIQKSAKAEKLTKLAEIYEVLRAAKMPKLEAVRIALINEAGQLKMGMA
jgi:hypothetical protein